MGSRLSNHGHQTGKPSPRAWRARPFLQRFPVLRYLRVSDDTVASKKHRTAASTTSAGIGSIPGRGVRSVPSPTFLGATVEKRIDGLLTRYVTSMEFATRMARKLKARAEDRVTRRRFPDLKRNSVPWKRNGAGSWTPSSMASSPENHATNGSGPSASESTRSRRVGVDSEAEFQR